MAIDTSKIIFYPTNTLRALKSWDILSNASIVGDNITINSGGYAGYDLSNDIGRGLSASLYKALKVSVNLVGLSQISDSDNRVEIVLQGVLEETVHEEATNLYKSVNLAPQSGKVTGSTYTANLVLPFPNRNFTSLRLLVLNHTGDAVTVTTAELYRSQDIASAQVGNSIGFGVTLAGFISYTDGFQVFYDGRQDPDSAWFMTDNDGNFVGVNWNNERLITYEHRDEALVI